MHIAAPWCEARSWQTSPQPFIVSTWPCKTDCTTAFLEKILAKIQEFPEANCPECLTSCLHKEKTHHMGSKPSSKRHRWIIGYMNPLFSPSHFDLFFFTSQKRVVLSFPSETISRRDMAIKASTFHFTTRLDLIHQWGAHPSLLPALPGTFASPMSCLMVTKVQVD